MNNLKINTKTTGFSSPAESYVTDRLDLNDLINPNPHSTFYFKYAGPDMFGIRKNNIIVVDRSIDPKDDELVVIFTKTGFSIERFIGQNNLWGRVSWVLKKQ